MFEHSSALPTKYKEPSTWLKEHTAAGAIVFNVNWTQFSALFFWNQHNYYIYGMDPVFLHKYDESLYWKIYNILIRDMGEVTCGIPDCDEEHMEPVYYALSRDFRASYVFVRRLSQTRFLDYLEKDRSHFEKVYDRGSSVIFQVLPEEGGKE